MKKVRNSNTRKSKKWFVKILSIVLGTITLIGAGFGVSKLLTNKYKTVLPTTFVVGSLNDNGEYLEDKRCIYTKDDFECQGLKIERDFSAKGTYQVYFYDVIGNFMGKTEELQVSLSGLPEEYEQAKTCRVVVRPEVNNDIKFYQVYGYANDYKIKTYINQNFIKFNKFTLDTANRNKSYNSEGKLEENTGYGISDKMLVRTSAEEKSKHFVVLSKYSYSELKDFDFAFLFEKQNADSEGLTVVAGSISLEDCCVKNISTEDSYYYDLTSAINDLIKTKNLTSYELYVSFNVDLNQTNPQVYIY